MRAAVHVFTWYKKREFSALAFDATGRHLAAGSSDDAAVVWDVVAGTERGRGLATPARVLHFSPVGNRLVLPTRYGLRVDELFSGTSFARFAVGTRIDALAVHPTRDLAVLYRNDGHRPVLSAVPLDHPNPEPVWNAPIGDLPTQGGYSTGLVSLSGETFVSAECVTGSVRRFRLAVRSWSDGSLLHSLAPDLLSYGDRIFGSPYRPAVVVQSGIWFRIQHADAPDAAARTVRNDGRKHFTGAAFHPSGKFLAATSNDATVKLFDTNTWEVARTFTWDIGRMRGIAFSPDGTLAAAGSDAGQVIVWDVDL